MNACKFHGQSAYITKLFCLCYIKSYCYTFIKMNDQPKPKFNPEEIIEKVNESNKIKMVKLYI